MDGFPGNFTGDSHIEVFAKHVFFVYLDRARIQLAPVSQHVSFG